MEKKDPGKKPKPKPGRMKDGADPVKNFEKWKKKYNRTKAQVKRDRDQDRDRGRGRGKRPQWQVEREDIQRLVSRYQDINIQDVVKFSDFPISKKTLLGLQDAQYRQPTEIQKQTIGLALQGRDVLGAAKTGSGKTLAFLIPVLERLYREQWSSLDGLGALIISPTRELAYQTYEVLRKVGRNHEFSAGLVIGGKELRAETERIHRTNIIICTPGRLLQHMDQTAAFSASELRLLVLDEADRILDMGFAETLNAIVENLPASRQTLLFSATQTKSVKDLARLSLKDPEYVWVHEKARFSTPATLEQSYVVVELPQKVNMLYSFIRTHLRSKVMVFFACCKEVQYLFRAFCRLRPGTPVLALHGKQNQMKRVEVYNDFLRKQSAVLFATDVAARGLDFPAVHWVLQFDCPEDADTYIHRVGRTARYRDGGEALLLLLPSEEEAMVRQLQDKKVPISQIQVNPEKLQSVQQKLEAFLAQEAEQKQRAQRCFVSYLRSVHLMRDKAVFDVFRLPVGDYARSLGLAVAPRVRFLQRAEAQRAGGEGEGPGGGAGDEGEGERGGASSEGEESEEEQQLRSFKAQLTERLPGGSSSEDGEDSEDDLRDLDLLTVKRRDVFNLTGAPQGLAEAAAPPRKKAERETKYSEAKKVLRRHFQVNTKVTFSEEGRALQLWPPVPRSAAPEDGQGDEDRDGAGIDVDKARERLRREDQEFDKQEYRSKVKAKHRERKLKERAARRRRQEDQGDGDQEDEVLAYLANHSDDEFDPSTLPDPDRPREDEEEEEEQEEDEPPPPPKKKKQLVSGEPAALDTGLSLAEDEELVLQLLSGSR
ncbi:probable ATP-dependent RNA helicase DDX10 [Salarias fasciatus]|uniref:ATP-dependent RNA helicase n=1 Tax=Salarias fasciatus TaxID=181472 RepID=A0A672G5D4_SALFA|nr:probable ATP-dependent RNA helicase DDX10 [Salarias fasciatus]